MRIPVKSTGVNPGIGGPAHVVFRIRFGAYKRVLPNIARLFVRENMGPV